MVIGIALTSFQYYASRYNICANKPERNEVFPRKSISEPLIVFWPSRRTTSEPLIISEDNLSIGATSKINFLLAKCKIKNGLIWRSCSATNVGDNLSKPSRSDTDHSVSFYKQDKTWKIIFRSLTIFHSFLVLYGLFYVYYTLYGLRRREVCDDFHEVRKAPVFSLFSPSVMYNEVKEPSTCLGWEINSSHYYRRKSEIIFFSFFMLFWAACRSILQPLFILHFRIWREQRADEGHTLVKFFIRLYDFLYEVWSVVYRNGNRRRLVQSLVTL